MRWQGKRQSGIREKSSKKTFKELKDRFITEPVLVTPDLDREMRVEVDMSDFTMGGMLLMKCENEK